MCIRDRVAVSLPDQIDEVAVSLPLQIDQVAVSLPDQFVQVAVEPPVQIATCVVHLPTCFSSGRRIETTSRVHYKPWLQAVSPKNSNATRRPLPRRALITSTAIPLPCDYCHPPGLSITLVLPALAATRSYLAGCKLVHPSGCKPVIASLSPGPASTAQSGRSPHTGCKPTSSLWLIYIVHPSGCKP